MAREIDRMSEVHKRVKAAIVRSKESFLRAGKITRETGTRFLKTELDTGFAFAEAAEGARTPGKRIRNLSKAREAYDSLVRFRGKVKLTSEEAAEIDSGIAELRNQLRQVGKSV